MTAAPSPRTSRPAPQPPPSPSSSLSPAELKQRGVQLFFDIYAADRRLQAAGDRAALAPFVEQCFTYDVLNQKHVFQGAQLFDALTARRVPPEPLLQALLVLESRLGRLHIAMRPPDAIRRLTPRDRQELLKAAPPSSSPFLEELEKKAVPEIIKEARQRPQRRRLLLPAAVLVFVALVVAVVVSLPHVRLKPANVAFPADAVPCTTQRTANQYLFCVVDEPRVANEDDNAIYRRMVVSQQTAQKAGFKEVAFLKPGLGPDGEQHRFKPMLWMRNPADTKRAVVVPSKLQQPPPKPPE